MSAAYAKGIGKSLPNAQISYDRFHVVALANAAMDEVRREEMRSSAVAVREAVGAQSKKTLRQLLWGMRKNPVSWTRAQFEAMHWLQRSNLKSARAWRLKQALQLVYRDAAASNSEEIAQGAMSKWLSWARRSRLEPFKRLALTLKEHFGGVVRGMRQQVLQACAALRIRMDFRQRRARSFNALSGRYDLYLALENRHPLLAGAGAVQRDVMGGRVFAAHLHLHGQPVAGPNGSEQAQVLADILGSRPRQACSQHSRDQDVCTNGLRGVPRGRRHRRFRIHIARLQREHVDVLRRKRAFEAGAVADGDLVEGAVAQNLQCVGGAIDRCGGRRHLPFPRRV